MELWRQGLVVRRLAEGCTLAQAAGGAGIDRTTRWRWCRSSPEFAQAFVMAREAGKDERTFRL